MNLCDATIPLDPTNWTITQRQCSDPTSRLSSRLLYLERWNMCSLSYVDVFVDYFLGLYQGLDHRWSHVY